MKKGVLLIIFLLLSLITICQDISVQGIVIDKTTKETLPGANIFLQSDWKIGSTSDDKGIFKLKLSKSLLNDTIVVSYVGYREKNIPVSSFNSKIFIIELESFTQLLAESVVKARRIIAEEFTVKQIKQLDIYLNPASKADPLLAINAMPSSTTTDESASISLRGSRPDETGIFLNDVPVYDAIRFSQLNGIGTFSIFNTSIVERMHIFAGNPPIEYGNTASGLVSLQTINVVPKENQNNITLGLANIGALTSQRLSNKSAVIAFTNYQPSQVLTGLNQDALQDLKNFESYDLGLHIIYNLNSKTRFKIFNYSNSEEYKVKYQQPSYDGFFDMNKKRNFTIANFIRQKNNSEFTINTGVNISSENYYFGNTDIRINKQDIYLSTAYQYFFNKISLKTGVSFDYRQNDAIGRKPMFYYAQNPENPSISFNSFDSFLLPDIFIYSKYTLTKNVILGAGIRKNIVYNNEPGMYSYQLNINYKPNSKNSFTLSGGHYNRLAMPNAEQIKITHYKGNQFSLDYLFTSEIVELQSSVFIKDVNYLEINNRIKGFELYSKINVNPFEFQFSFTTLDANTKNDSTNYPSEFDLDYFFRGVIKYKLKNNIEVSTIYIFRQGSYYLPITGSNYINSYEIYSPIYCSLDNIKRLPDYQKLDISVSKYWVINSNFAVVLFGSVSNLFNNKNVMCKNYNFDYSESFNELYSKRTYYFGFSLMF